jgi:hypothetical protein
LKASRTSFPILRIVGGLLFVVAGIFAYLGLSLGNYAALVLIFGGVIALLVAITGWRQHPWDIALFLMGAIILSGVSAGYSSGPALTTYSATNSQVHSESISLHVAAVSGSVDITFIDRPGFAYQINFTRSFPFFTLWPSGGDSVSNSTIGGFFNLNVQSSGSSISILLGKQFRTDLDIHSDTGSVTLQGSGDLSLANVTLSSSTGSVNCVLDSTTVESLVLSSSTGSVSLDSAILGTGSRSVPVTLTSSTGSVNLHASVQASDSVALTARTDLGSINHSLTGFVVSTDARYSLVASAGIPTTSRGSFVMSASSNLGSVSLTLGILS